MSGMETPSGVLLALNKILQRFTFGLSVDLKDQRSPAQPQWPNVATAAGLEKRVTGLGAQERAPTLRPALWVDNPIVALYP